AVRARLAALRLGLRFVLLAVGLVAIGLVVAGVATRYALERFLIQRVDQQASPATLHQLSDGIAGEGPPQAAVGLLPKGSFATVIPACQTCHSLDFNPEDTAGDADDLQHLASDAPYGYSSADDYRIVVVPVHRFDPNNPAPANARLVVAMPLSDVNSTLNRLVLLELLIGLAVLGAVGGLAYVLVRRELQPLQRIEDTAAAIAAGDLSR